MRRANYLGRASITFPRTQGQQNRRRQVVRRLLLEPLEDRTMLSESPVPVYPAAAQY
jgi:hypothetical protein